VLEIGSRSFEIAGGPTVIGCGTAVTGDARRGQRVRSGRRGRHEERLGSPFLFLLLLLLLLLCDRYSVTELSF